MKVVFMGTPQAAVSTLERLIADGHDVVAVYSQPDRPSGRGNKLTFSPVKQSAMYHGLKVLQPEKIRTVEAEEEFRSLDADVAIVVAYGRILPESFLNAFTHGAMNVHFSLLPKYRGAAPVNWAIANGETVSGVTTMKIDTGLDTGDILLQREIPIGSDESTPELLERLSFAGAELLSETLSNLNSIVPMKQDENRATSAPILRREDGRIDWAMKPGEIVNRVRGFQPFPSSFTFRNGTRLTIWKTSVGTTCINKSLEPGTVTEIRKGAIVVSCGENACIEAYEIQPEGKRRMTAAEYVNGSHLKVGEVFGK